MYIYVHRKRKDTSIRRHRYRPSLIIEIRKNNSNNNYKLVSQENLMTLTSFHSVETFLFNFLHTGINYVPASAYPSSSVWEASGEKVGEKGIVSFMIMVLGCDVMTVTQFRNFCTRNKIIITNINEAEVTTQFLSFITNMVMVYISFLVSSSSPLRNNWWISWSGKSGSM